MLLLGVTFKENCPDVRNSKIFDVISFLKQYEINVTISDPWVDVGELKKEFEIDCMNEIPEKKYDGIVLAVAHREFLKLDLSPYKKDISIVYDVKSVLQEEVDGKL